MSSYLYKKIETLDDVTKAGNKMAKDNYPVGMSSCYIVGINGDCGMECPVLKAGECDSDEMNEEYGVLDDET